MNDEEQFSRNLQPGGQQTPGQSPVQEMDKEPGQDETTKASKRASVKQWQSRIKNAEKYFESDFKRMKKAMEFAVGIQSDTQESLDSEDYRANFVNREVNQKVASLYARDPKAVARRRKRLDYQMWDGDPVSKMNAEAAMQQGAMLGLPPNPQAAMLLQDIQQGDAWKKMCDKVGRTLEILYQYQCDTQAPDFKYQMKQLVRRVVTTGVGYVRLNFSRLGDSNVLSTGTDDSVSYRIKKAKMLLEQMDDGKFEKDDARALEVQDLMNSVMSSVQQGDMQNVEERLDFDFPSATSIIVDPRCKALKGFVGARWIAQKYIVPLDFVRAYFEVEISTDGEGSPTIYKEDGVERQPSSSDTKDDPEVKPLVALYEVFDLNTKSYCFLVAGFKDFVQDPTPCDPCINRFWPIFSLTFNDCEVEPGCKVHIYPPSDVDLLKHPQKEWNRARQALREHRGQNAPMYVTRSGWLTDEGPDCDIEKLKNHVSGEVVQVQGNPPDGDISKALVAFRPAPIDANVYNTQPYEQDATLVVGTNQPQEPPKARTAATPAVIQEQARISGTSSNVDDLDDLLSELARASGEMMLREFSPKTVERIVGRGMAWPDQQREDFLNEIFLDIVASSSGRPNKAVEIDNWTKIAPIMLQSGANPWGIIQESAKRLDDRIEVADFAPVAPPQQGPPGPGQQPPKPPGPQGPNPQVTGGPHPGVMTQ